MALEWSERFGIHRARVGRVGDLVVAWGTGGYVVTAFGASLKNRSADAEDGKRRAVELARKLLAQASAELSE